MSFPAYAISDVGQVRENNEDRVAIRPDLGLYVVADGIGGAAGGEVAASLAITKLLEGVERHLLPGLPTHDDHAADIMQASFLHASEAVVDLGESTSNLSGMGTTMTALLLHGMTATIAHVGDSRLYRIRRGCCRQVTTDHTMAEQLIADGYDPADPLVQGRLLIALQTFK